MKGSIRKSGSFEGKSNRLGYGGRAAQLKAKGVPGGVIGELARKAKAAPGMKNYHGGKEGSKADKARDMRHDVDKDDEKKPEKREYLKRGLKERAAKAFGSKMFSK